MNKKKDFKFATMKYIIGAQTSYTLINDCPNRFSNNYVLGTGKLYKRHNNKYRECDMYEHYVDDIMSMDDQILLISIHKAELFPSRKEVVLDTTGYWYTTDKNIIFFQCSSLYSESKDAVIVYNREFQMIDHKNNLCIIDMVKDTKTDVIYTCSKYFTCSLMFCHHIHGDLCRVHTVQPHHKIFSTGRFDKDIYYIQYLDSSIYFYDTNGDYVTHFAHYPYIIKIEHIQNFVYSVLYLQNRIVFMNLTQKKNMLSEIHDYCIIIDYDYNVPPVITDNEEFVLYLKKYDEDVYLCCMQLYGKYETYLREISNLSYSCLNFYEDTVYLGTHFGAIIEYSISSTELEQG